MRGNPGEFLVSQSDFLLREELRQVLVLQIVDPGRRVFRSPSPSWRMVGIDEIELVPGEKKIVLRAGGLVEQPRPHRHRRALS